MTSKNVMAYGPTDLVGPLFIASPLDIPSLNINPEEMALRLIILENEMAALKCQLDALTREGKGDG